jgi:hypothetical protein
MAAIVRLTPLDDRGRELLNELERATAMRPQETFEDGSRSYWLSAAHAGVDGFDPMLDKLDANWREHVSRPDA